MESIASFITSIVPPALASVLSDRPRPLTPPGYKAEPLNNTFNIYGGSFTSANNIYQISPEGRADEIARMIPSVDYRPRHRKISQTRVQNTGMWLLETEPFSQWLQFQTNRLLWCYGVPGSGKSTITSVVVDYLQAQGALVGFVYFDYSRQSKEHHLPMVLASILRQVLDFGLKTGHSFVSAIDRFYKPFSRVSISPTTDELLNILYSVFEQYGKPIFLCLDALDECSDNDGHTAELLRNVLRLPPNVRIFVTGREMGPFTRLCDTYAALKQRITPQYDDLRVFICHRVQQDMPSFVQQLDKICDKVANNAIQTQSFILARLHMDKLAALRSVGEIDDALKNLKGDVDEAYAESIARIQRQDEYRRSSAQKVLTWIACYYDVHTLEELQYALAVRPGLMDVQDYVWSEETITSFCMGLVRIDDDGENGKFVVFTHHTVYEFLQTVRQKLLDGFIPDPGTVYHYLKGLKYADADITKTCLLFLSNGADFKLSVCLKNNWSTVADMQRKYPFIGYISHAWPNHAEGQESLILNELCNFLADDDRAGFLLWLLSELPKGTQDCKNSYGLFVAAMCGLPQTMWNLIRHGKRWPQDSISYQENVGTTPLHLAVFYGFDEILQMLLETEDILADPKDKDGRTPLSVVCEMGYDSMFAEMLLDCEEVDPDSLDCKGRSPLSYAAGSSSVEVVKLFATVPGVEWDRRDQNGRTPVSYGAESLQTGTLEYLVTRNDIIFDTADSIGRTPLSYAAQRGLLASVNSLLETRRVNPDSEDKFGRRPLSYAVEPQKKDRPEERLATVMRLLETGSIDVNAKDQRGWTALFHACKYSATIDIVARLLSMPIVDVDVIDCQGQTALDIAMSSGNYSAARLLIRRTSNPNPALLAQFA